MLSLTLWQEVQLPFDYRTFLAAVVGILIGALLLLFAYVLLKAIKAVRAKSGDKPGVDAVTAALMPYVKDAIWAGERALLESINTFDNWIDGIDKAAVAAKYYNLLPDLLLVAGFPPMLSFIYKRIVTLDDFTRLVSTTYDAMRAQWERDKNYLTEDLAQLEADANTAADPPPQVDPSFVKNVVMGLPNTTA